MRTRPQRHGIAIDGQTASSAAARIAASDLSAGTHVLTVTATDSSNTTATASVTVTVNAANGAPTARADTVFGRAARTIRADVVANDTDPEGDIDPWSVAVVVPAALGTAAADRAAPGTITYSAAAPVIDVGVYEVCDRFLQCASAEFVVAILEDH